MAKFLHTQFSFSNGELNPRLLGRTDIKEYFNSGKEITNFAVATEGGLTQCMGSLHAGQTDVSSEKFLFTFFDKYAFRVESGVPKIYSAQRYPPGNGHMLDSFGITVDVSGVVGGYFNDFVYSTHVVINNAIFIASNGVVEPLVILSTGTDDFPVFELYSWRAYGAAFGGLVGGTVALAARTYPLSVKNNQPARVWTLSGAGTNIVSTDPDFVADMVGSNVSLLDNTDEAVYEITVFNSTTDIDVVRVDGVALADGPYTRYREALWWTNNFPKVVSFFEQRLILANTVKDIDTMWLSELENLTRFSIDRLNEIDAPTVDERAFDIIPATKDVSQIMWIEPERYISFGTETEEYIVNGADGLFSAGKLNVQSVSKYGSHAIGLALRAQGATYFVERGGKVLREMSFSEENGGYAARNIGVLGPDLTEISKIVYDFSRKRIYVQSDQGLSVVAIDAASGVLAWSQINLPASQSPEISGLMRFGHTVLNDILLYRENLTDNFLTFYREGVDIETDSAGIAALGKFTVFETSGNDYSLPRAYDPNPFVPGVSTIFVLNENTYELVELPIQLAAVGHPLFTPGVDLYVTSPDFVVRTFAQGPWEDAVLETTPIQQGSRIGDSQIALQRIDKAGVRLYESMGDFEISTSDTSISDVVISNEAPFTGVKEECLDGTPEIDHTIKVKNTGLRPIYILGVMARGMGEEG